MRICKHGHVAISYLRGECPLCMASKEIRELRLKVNHLKFELLVSETELLMDFDMTGEKKMFSSVGQA